MGIVDQRGAWIEVEGRRVDLIYRDLGRVAAAIEDSRAGRVGTHFQVVHPAGFSPQIYAAEVHFCHPLEDLLVLRERAGLEES